MKVKHKETGKIYDYDPIRPDDDEFREGFAYIRTNSDFLEQTNPEKYKHIIDQKIQTTIFYIKEPLSDFEILENDSDNT